MPIIFAMSASAGPFDPRKCAIAWQFAMRLAMKSVPRLCLAPAEVAEEHTTLDV
jgi:hypothetical protein